MLKRSVIIVAGGKGLRMGQALPKQFLLLRGKPIIVHTVEAFLRFDAEIAVTLVINEDTHSIWKEIHEKYLSDVKITLASGGATRFQSVKSGLETIKEGLVAIHDAVRPLTSPEIIKKSYNTAEADGAGIVMVPLKDSIRKKIDGRTRSEDRSDYYLVQTPQTFQVELIKRAFDQDESPTFTDDAAVFEAAGMKVSVVPGDYKNIKITTPEDMLVAEALMK